MVPRILSALRSATGRPMLIVALGTNDDPSTPEAFRAQVRRLVAAAPSCVVWVTVHRPGGRWEALNQVLQQEATSSGGRLALAGWDRLVAGEPALVQSDGIHPRTGTAYRSMVALATTAAATCSG